MTSYYALTSHRRHSRATDWTMGGDAILNMIQRKPEALLLIGAGLALMLRGGGKFMGSSSSSRQRDWRAERRSAYGDTRASGRRAYQPTGADDIIPRASSVHALPSSPVGWYARLGAQRRRKREPDGERRE